jgi:nucleobase:cation symporter-1, NCS1 family
MCILCGSFTGSSIRHSDWSRYAATPRAHLLGIWLVGPLAVSITAIFSVLVTSAAAQMYGEIYWQPITLLLHIQSTNYSAGVRAGTFFVGLGWFMSQLAVRAPQPYLCRVRYQIACADLLIPPRLMSPSTPFL